VNRNLKLVLCVSIIASFVAFLDGSVVNVALPAITRDLGGGLQVQQWVVDAYLLSLGSLILLAGSLSDLFGRKKILTFGLLGFGAASILCALAPSSVLLIIGRGIQGIAGALLVPSSLALIISNFSGKAQAKAIGTWTAWTGIAFIIGPLLGGFLVDSLSWRFIFAINIVPIVLCLILMNLMELEDEPSSLRLDVEGAIFCSLGLLGTVFALIEQPHYGWSSPIIYLTFVAGILMLNFFVYYEKSIKNPILPLSLFKTRNFSAGNISTILIYGGLSVATFIIVIFLQQVSGYSALSAGLALLPITIIMFIMSPQFGKLAGKYGPRLFMSIGPIVAGVGFMLMLSTHAHVIYLSQLLPGVIFFAIGLSTTVAPLTSAVLGDVDPSQAGIASAVNNAISRIAGLITTAIIGLIVGEKLNVVGFHHALMFTATLLFISGIVSFIGIRNKKPVNNEMV
jgi:EmrB/QacA subfamily drug resistance transporter